MNNKPNTNNTTATARSHLFALRALPSWNLLAILLLPDHLDHFLLSFLGSTRGRNFLQGSLLFRKGEVESKKQTKRANKTKKVTSSTISIGEFLEEDDAGEVLLLPPLLLALLGVRVVGDAFEDDLLCGVCGLSSADFAKEGLGLGFSLAKISAAILRGSRVRLLSSSSSATLVIWPPPSTKVSGIASKLLLLVEGKDADFLRDAGATNISPLCSELLSPPLLLLLRMKNPFLDW